MTEKPTKFEGKVVAQNVQKVDALKLAMGKPAYTADYMPPGLLHVKILNSPHAHARITKIDVSKAEALPGVHGVMYHANTPKTIRTTAGQGYPEPSPYDDYMFDTKVRFVGDRVAAVAAESMRIAEKACELIEVEYEILPAILDFEKSRDPGAPVIHDEEEAHVPIPVFYDPKNNHMAHVDFEVGSIEKGLEDADVVVERTVYTQYSQHTPLEPHVTLAYPDDGRIIIRTSTQVPFHARRITAQTLGIPVRKIRVIKPRIGGGFGAKQEVLNEDIVALFVIRTNRPVLLELSREEEFVSSRTRHPMRSRIKVGAKKDGTITALDLEVLSNTGAYGSQGLTVMSNAGSKTLPLYRCENVRFVGDTVYTNMPVGGAYRGYGATQSYFVLETVMDEIAEKIGMDPLELRYKNHIQVGETSPVFKALGEGKEGVDQTIGSCELAECIRLGAEDIKWGEPRETSEEHIKRGVGMCILMQGSSIPQIDMGAAYAKINDDGSFNLHVGATDLGTGSDTVLSQIFAEELDIPLEDVIIYSSDTDMTPFDVGAYASSTTYLSGEAVRKAAEIIKQVIIKVAAEMMSEKKEDLECQNKTIFNPDNDSSVTFGEVAKYALYEHNQFQISSTASHVSTVSPPPFSAHFADIEVDTETGQVKVVKYVAAVDCGTAIHPKLAEGQTEGSVLNGISYALTEEMLFNDKGKVVNPSFRQYKIYSTKDMFELKTILVPSYEPTGPFGAKSVSEISINGPLPAIANAIYDAVGIRLLDAPFTAEKVLKALKEKKKAKTVI
jgi:probable selenate reductase molybdenum-binding subunit